MLLIIRFGRPGWSKMFSQSVRAPACVFALAVSLAVAPTAWGARSATARCTLVGPVVVSSYLAFLENVAAKKRTGTAERAQSTVHLMALYERIGCPVPELNQAIECISSAALTQELGQPLAKVAEQCMRDSGMGD